MNHSDRLLSGLLFVAACLFQVPTDGNQGEVGVITVSQSGANQWHSVETILSYVNPVVILGPPTDNDNEPLSLRVRNVSADGFQFQLDPWDYLPAAHGEETISYLVMEAGSYTLANGARIEAGISNGISSSTFSFQDLQAGFEEPPAIVAQVVSVNHPGAVTTQLHDIQTGRVTMRLIVEEANIGSGHPAEKVAWVAIEPSSLQGTRQYISGISENKIGSVKVPLGFGLGGFDAASPFFSHQRRFNDSDTATLRHQAIQSSSTILYQQEENSVNQEMQHASDFISFLIFQSAGEIPFNPKPPVANDDTVVINPFGKINLNPLVNDVDQEGDVEPTTLAIESLPSYGTATLDTENGRVIYTHTQATETNDEFTYSVKDSRGDKSNVGRVTIQFDETNRLPNTTLALPDSIQLGIYKLKNAFPSLSFFKPVNMATPPGETKRLFIVEKPGFIRVVDDISSSKPTQKTFLDLSSRVSTLAERGLLGLAFHPNYANNGFFYVVYTDKIVPTPDPGPFGTTRHTILSRFKVSADDPDRADLASETVMIRQVDRDPGHQAGDLEFGPDGYLYYSTGDEGTQTDTFNNTQTITKDFFSGILRIDVDKRPGNPEPNPHVSIKTDGDGLAYYSVPADNPWVGASEFEGVAFPPLAVVRTEFWAVGFRNPWQMSFDPLNGDLYVGDVGTGLREEINRVVKGGNYQWAYKEGTVEGAKSNFMPAGFTGIPPLHDYSRAGSAAAVIGGIVYRGNRLAKLDGTYLFGDYQLNKIWSYKEDQDGNATVDLIAFEGGITSFFADPGNGDPLISDFEGKIWRLEEDKAAAPEIPANLSQTGAFADLTSLTPNPGMYDYDPNVRFWSDHADKRRWFSVPDLADKMIWQRDKAWDYPEGMVWVKHFDLEMERGNEASKKRIETRFLVKTTDGSYGLSYQWNEEETEAYLVPSEGADIDYQISVDGESKMQTWRIPGRVECLQCHTAVAGDVLSFNTRQLNNTATMFGPENNQLTDLENNNFFSNTIHNLSSLPKYVNLDDTSVSLTTRVRSYLAVNCISCHQPGGTGLGSWDSRPELTLEQTGLINGFAGNNGGQASQRLVVPGKPENSILLSRISGCCGLSRMPPLASSELDEEAIQSITEWILSLENKVDYQEWRIANFGSDSSPEGEKTFDADLDTFSNYVEFLTNTDPGNLEIYPDLIIDLTPEKASLVFQQLDNRAIQIEVSEDLENWEIWNAENNASVFPNENLETITIEGPVKFGEAQRLYFRIRIREP